MTVIAVLILGVLSPWSPPASAATAIDRVAGADRYAVSAAASARAFPSGARVAFLASGHVFADALAGAPAATTLGGPVLLTQPSGLPPAIRDELARLAPTRVVIFGGAGAVSDTVAEQVLELVGVAPERWSGDDRYGSAVAISRQSHPAGAPVVFLASGEMFPDALSGAPGASAQSAPVLLTAAEALPDVIETELVRLRPGRIVMLGGAGSVSDGVAEQARALTGAAVERWSGTDRYATAAEVSRRTFTAPAQTVYLASGTEFADALSGAPVAGRERAPVLLTRADALPGPTMTELRRLKPARVVILGGDAAVWPQVAQHLAFIAAELPPATGGRLTRSTEVHAGECLSSPNGAHALCVSADGRIEVRSGGASLWQSGSSGRSAGALRIGTDGNLVLVAIDGSVMWQSSTAGTAAVELVVGDDGDVNLRTSTGQVVWSTMTSPSSPRWRMPYLSGQWWAAGAPHSNSGGTGARGSLDFGPTAGGDRRVVAIADGVVYRVQCQSGSYLGINHAGGWQSTYYHLVNYQNHLVGQRVTAGTYLGDVGRTVPCGGGATFDHVHLVIRRGGVPVSVEGMRFGAYTARSDGRDYWGYWTDAWGNRVLTAPGGARCCLPAE